MSSERKRHLISRIEEILRSELLNFSIEEIDEIEKLIFDFKNGSISAVPIFKRIYEIIKKRTPDEPTRRRRPQ